MKPDPASLWHDAMKRARRWLAGRIDPEGRAITHDLAKHLDRLGHELFDRRYGPDGLGACCYQAVIDYEEWAK